MKTKKTKMNEENIDFIVSNNIETNLKELDRALRHLNDYEQIDLILDDKRGYKLFKFMRFVTGLKKFQQELDLDCLFEPSKAYEKFSNIFDFIIREIINDLDFENCAKNFNLKIDADYLVYNSDHEHIFIKWGKTSEWECFGGKLFGQCESNLKEITKDDIIYKCTICHIYNLCKDCFMQPKSEFTCNEQRIFILDDLLAILNSLLPYSFKLHLFLLEKSKLKIALDLINNEDFLKNAYAYSPDIIHSFLSIMNVLSKNAEDKKTVWKELNAIPSLLNVLNISTRLTLSVHSTLANIVDDNEIEQLNGLIQSIIQNDIKRLYKFATQFKKEQLTRSKQQFRDEQNKIFFHEVAVLVTKIGSLSLTDCLQNIYKLSLNPNAKLEIFNKNNFKKSIKIIIKHGNEIEKKFCIQVLAQLAFDSRVIDEIVKDSSLTSMVKKIAQNDTVQLKKLKIASKQLLWLIQENDHETNRKIADFDSSDGHIMISYHSNNRDICIQIKNELEKENFKVWVDLNEKSPSSLDSMVKAVERAKCVLICVNEVYRQNFNCQVIVFLFFILIGKLDSFLSN